MSDCYREHLIEMNNREHFVRVALRDATFWGDWCHDPEKIERFINSMEKGLEVASGGLCITSDEDTLLTLIFEDAGDYFLEEAMFADYHSLDEWYRSVEGSISDIRFLHKFDLDEMLTEFDAEPIEHFFQELSIVFSIIVGGISEVLATGNYIPIDERYE